MPPAVLPRNSQLQHFCYPNSIDISRNVDIILAMELIEIFKALSNETRLHILEWLREPSENFPPQGEHFEEKIDLQGGVCVGSIKDKAGISQSTVSHYLDMMQKAGLLLAERHGKWTYYRRNEKLIQELSRYIGTQL